MKTKIFLRENKAKLTINFEFRNASIRFRGATPYTVNNRKEWDEKAERIKLPSTRVNALRDNINLNEISTKFLEGIANYKINEITSKQISEIYNQVIDNVCGKKAPVTATIPSEDEELNVVLNYFDFFIKKYQAQPTPSTKKVIKKSSMASYKSAKKQLELYLTKNKIVKFTFDDINEKFYDNFIDFLQNKELSLNYIGTIIRKLKTIMKSAFSREISSNIDFQKPYFIAQNEVVNNPYLTEEEIEKITSLKIEVDEVKNIRDIFVLQCY